MKSKHEVLYEYHHNHKISKIIGLLEIKKEKNNSLYLLREERERKVSYEYHHNRKISKIIPTEERILIYNRTRFYEAREEREKEREREWKWKRSVEKSVTRPVWAGARAPIVRLIGLYHVLYIMVVSKMRFNDI